MAYLFPSIPSCGPLVFWNESFDLSFIKNHVVWSSLSTNNSCYIKWLDRVQKKKEKVWKDHGNFHLIQISRVGPKYNSDMVFASIWFSESTTNTFLLPCIMITQMLLIWQELLVFNYLGKLLNPLGSTKSNPNSTLLSLFIVRTLKTIMLQLRMWTPKNT